ncbi:MAG TPA: DUF2971 domain-containing protein [Pyrinomonadaceae bacterium]|jgi:hypothetical protein|nr:DUF2971 domain-containing protein [Pyrinomonadaceae bacterium]
MVLTLIDFPTSAAPDTLYHYTGLDAFRSIITHRILWLSDIAKMNDAKERLWISEVFERVWRTRSESGVGVDEARHYFHDFQLDDTPVFITCFSEDGDLLSQWRAYTDDGRGVAIGFRTPRLGFPIESRFIDEFMEEQRVAITKCMYDREKQAALMNDLIGYFDRHFVDLASNRQSGSIYAYDGFLNTASWCLRNMSVISKHPGFSEEREWRAIYWPHGYGEKEGFVSASVGPRAQRVRKGEDSAYHEWQLEDGDSLIAEIVLGPKSPLSEGEVLKMLGAHGFSGFGVRRSETPYR